MHLSIKKWPEQERPRERLLQQGPASLSDAELLAISSARVEHNILQSNWHVFCCNILVV